MLRPLLSVLIAVLAVACRSAEERPPLRAEPPGTMLPLPEPRALPASMSGASRGQGALVEVAAFEHQVTGVTVSEEGRIFVCFPRWTEDVAVSVAEVRDGELRPYPDNDWNAWRNLYALDMSAQRT
jgi:hypothetical protein